MKTRTRLFLNSTFILILLLFVGWGLKDKSATDDPKALIVLVKYKTQPTKGKEALLALNTLIEQVKKEPHFVSIKLHVDPKDNTNILLYEKWNDASYYNSKHMETSHLQKFISDSRAFLVGPPEISFWNVEKEFK